MGERGRVKVRTLIIYYIRTRLNRIDKILTLEWKHDRVW